VAERYLAKRQIRFTQFILHYGDIPKELSSTDFEYLDEDTKVKLICGNTD
jgi:hypothetical protein